MRKKTVQLLFGKSGMAVDVPASAAVLRGQLVAALPDAQAAVAAALAAPIGTAPLADLVKAKRPRSVAITISDITRPVPNRDFLPAILRVLGGCGVRDGQVVVIIGTGMHRPSTAEERAALVGPELLGRVEVIDHRADDASTLVKVSDDPPVSVNRRFAESDFRICTGYVEPHFMAGFSGGRKGVCPALADLATIQRFHGYATLADPRADNGVLSENPCHEIALAIAKRVGVDFLFNVAIARDRRIAGIYCGDLAAAHEAGCRQVAQWTTAGIDGPFDLVVTNGGGWPLDQTFYQAVKGMCTALPALHAGSTLLIAADCREQVGSRAYWKLMLRWSGDWRGFLAHIAASGRTELDQWEYQMQSRVLARIGVERLRFVCDEIPPDVQRHLSVTPVGGEGGAAARMQRAIDEYVAANPHARVAVLPDGPYTMLKRKED